MKELCLLFLKLGTTAFGGPAAHIAMMEDEVVRRRKWISHEGFLDLLGATNLIPGPNSTEMAIHIGYLRGGWKGLIAAGACFIFPAVALTLLLASLYTEYGSLPQVHPFVAGIRPAVIAVIIAAVVRLAKPVVRKRTGAIALVLVALLNVLGIDEILLLLGAGIIGMLWNGRTTWLNRAALLCVFAPFAGAQISPSGETAAHGASLTGLGLFFLKIGSILYGGGYVLVAFLQAGLVDTRHWLSQAQLFDAIAVGQFTPGPVLSTATFIGYLILGLPGASVATAGIFLPSFLFVLISNPLIPKLRSSVRGKGFLEGVNAASLGLMLAVTVKLASGALPDAGSWIILGSASLALLFWNLNTAWIVAGSALFGWFFSLL